ncbi:MAG: hypothetical protein HYT48_01190 [Candidatus Vogelbacteria bacterium]|nr:hypothetical protein [Candidatus Vogelbacteria bacterium]
MSTTQIVVLSVFAAIVMVLVAIEIKILLGPSKKKTLNRLFEELSNRPWGELKETLEKIGVIWQTMGGGTNLVNLWWLRKLKKEVIARVVGSIFHNEPVLRESLAESIIDDVIGANREKLKKFAVLAGRRHLQNEAIATAIRDVLEKRAERDLETEVERLKRKVLPAERPADIL